MPKAPRRKSGEFARRPLALRRAVLAVLDRVDRLTVREIAGAVYGGRLCLYRPVPSSRSQINSTRKALHRLITKGRVVVVGHDRRCQLFARLDREPFPPLDLGPLDG